MTKDEFKSMQVLDQIEYINNRLSKDDYLTVISNSMGIDRSILRDRFKKANYAYHLCY